MTDVRCVICTRHQPRPAATICGHCLARIDDNLARIAELTAWAASWLMPRTGHGDTGRSVLGSKPPLDIASLDAAITWQDAADYLRQNAPQEHQSANACEACAWLTAIAMLELRGKS